MTSVYFTEKINVSSIWKNWKPFTRLLRDSNHWTFQVMSRTISLEQMLMFVEIVGHIVSCLKNDKDES